MDIIPSERTSREVRNSQKGGRLPCDRPFTAYGWTWASTEASTDQSDGRRAATLSRASKTRSLPGNEPVLDLANPPAPRSHGTFERERQTGYLESCIRGR